MHFCDQELFMIVAGLPFVGYFVWRIRHAWHWLRGHRGSAHRDGCCVDDHAEEQP